MAVAVAGNKADLPHANFDLAAAEAQCAALGVPFHLTSADTGEVKPPNARARDARDKAPPRLLVHAQHTHTNTYTARGSK